MKTEIARLTRRAGLGAVTVLAAALALGSTVTAVSPRAQAAAPPSARAVMPLPILASARIDPAAIGRLYNDAIVRDGNIDRVIAALTAATHDVSRPKRYRANASLVRAHLQWRHGRLPLALTAIDEGLAIEAYDDLVYFKARALDASGKTDQARDGYQQALALTTSPKLRESIRLRLTIADAVDQNVQGLTALAKASPRDFRNRAAITLGILDFSKEAADLYEVSPQGPEAFREHLRVAQWAVKAGDARRAQDEAWQAVQAATLDRDRKYSLSLLVEAHTLDKSLDALLDRLARQPALTPDEESLRIDLLRQTGKYAQAISLFKSAHAGELSIDLRQELLRIYRDAGQDAAMIAEYQHLIATEPAATAWPEGLGQYYLEQADPANARRVWADFLDRNTDVDTLLAGSESMTSFGLHDLALAAAGKALAQTGAPETAARIRLAQFELFRHRGLNGEAEATLGALDALLAPDSPYRMELADAYERLQKPQLAAKTLEAFSKSKGGLGVDEKMRLAWLLDSIGRRDDALQLWHEMWSTETLASRRRLIEDRLLLLAAELGSLGDLAVDLEEKLAKGTAAPQDVSLLVDIYTKVGDSVSAIEVVTSAAAQHGKTTESEVASLKEQAQIYLALSEYGDFARVTRRLVDLDPANKVDYLQSLLLNQIEAGSDGAQSPQDATCCGVRCRTPAPVFPPETLKRSSSHLCKRPSV